jgi:hypothetical protein
LLLEGGKVLECSRSSWLVGLQGEEGRGVEDSRFSYLARLWSGGARLLKRIRLLNSDRSRRGDRVLGRSKLSYLVIGGVGAELKLLV